MVELALRVAVVSFTAVLTIAAISILIWMAATSWTDGTGTTVGAIFAVLAGIQVALSVLWFKVTVAAESKAKSKYSEEHTLTSFTAAKVDNAVA